jgi:ferrochelatase
MPDRASAIDGLLVLGFGGPTPGCCGRRATCPKTPGCEAECFVAGILGDNPARMGRIDEVVHHYQSTGGGFSPYHDLTKQQAGALGTALAARGRAMPVALGFRHWTPWTRDGVAELYAAGCRRAAVLILAPHQSSVSWDWYLKHAAEAAEALGERAPELVAVVPPWWTMPGYISANAAELRAATAGWSSERIAAASLIFTAHAIPQPVESTSAYRQQFVESAQLVAAAFGHPGHQIAFQSQPTDSRVPWSAPTIESAIDAAHAAGARDVLVQALGFLVDHTEVLFDLDVETRERSHGLGLTYTRARCVHDHADFINGLADAVVALQA